MANDEESEFGRGVIYPLSLFIAHQFMRQEQVMKFKKEGNKKLEAMYVGMWFNGAKDHLLEVNKTGIEKIDVMITFLKKFCFDRDTLSDDGKHVEEIDEAISLAKNIMFELDKHFKFDPVKAEWS